MVKGLGSIQLHVHTRACKRKIHVCTSSSTPNESPLGAYYYTFYLLIWLALAEPLQDWNILASRLVLKSACTHTGKELRSTGWNMEIKALRRVRCLRASTRYMRGQRALHEVLCVQYWNSRVTRALQARVCQVGCELYYKWLVYMTSNSLYPWIQLCQWYILSIIILQAVPLIFELVIVHTLDGVHVFQTNLP